MRKRKENESLTEYHKRLENLKRNVKFQWRQICIRDKGKTYIRSKHGELK
jgi:hypothetical protein